MAILTINVFYVFCKITWIKIIIKLVNIKENFVICDIWRIRNPKRQNFSFRQNHSTGFKESWLDYIFVSNCLQEFVNYTDVLPAISTDHSPVLISLSNDNSDNNGRCPVP